ncbi:neutral zinc metallopeptidase [Propionibacteriaceae bacterium G57]|uniref:neutral zinc metallopeptidase n=1 Tax=Aestuariimicrobium sp. G57 TaxID=3418485 RepID=UPI003DA74260
MSGPQQDPAPGGGTPPQPGEWWPFRGAAAPSGSGAAGSGAAGSSVSGSGAASAATPTRPETAPTQQLPGWDASAPTQQVPTWGGQPHPTVVMPGVEPQPVAQQPVPQQWPPHQQPQWHAPQQPWLPRGGAMPPAQQWPAQQWPAQQWPAQRWPQQATAASPATSSRGKTGRTVAVLALFLVCGVVAGAVLTNIFGRAGSTAASPPPVVTGPGVSPSSATPTPTPTRSPSSARPTPYQVPPTKWSALPKPSPTNQAQRVTQANALYALEFPSPMTCPTIPEGIEKRSEFQKLARQLVTCQYEAWAPVFEQTMGFKLSKPGLVIFAEQVKSPCGTVDDDQSFYCPNSAEIYLSEKRFESSQDWWRLHFANTIAHEFLHHLQSEAGILEGAYSLDMTGDERTRRVELQAYCMTSRMMVVTPAYEFGDRDYQILKAWAAEGDSSKTHGSVASRKNWWMRGLEQKTLGGCNTWVVPASQVT